VSLLKAVCIALGNGPARRNLFGPVDREQLQEASRRWGFDFILDKPLESSDFQWEGIPGTKVPLLYRSCMLERHGELNLKDLEKTPEKRENTGLKRKQTNITDFYQAKRRVVGMPRKSGE
uniref:Cyclin-dependent kinase inhibitor domain-containing protein n=1 Tax=Lates calcarifer TaxID=8187 RepID=A0A4W6ELM8_LATCA